MRVVGKGMRMNDGPTSIGGKAVRGTPLTSDLVES